MANDKQQTPAADNTAILIDLVKELKAGREQAPEIQARAMKKAVNPSNEVAPGISIFNPRGEKDFPMPALKCEIRAPWTIHPAYHGLDREEVELFNLIEPGEYTVTLNDDSKLVVCVVGTRNTTTGVLEKMSLHGASEGNGKYASLFTKENKDRLPSMRKMLRDMLGDAANGVRTMPEERAAIASGQLEVSIA